MKATAVAPSNIAFIKYWGRKNEKLRLPVNSSISMNLSNLLTITTVEFRNDLKKDFVKINGEEDTNKRVTGHLNKIRKLANITTFAKVFSENNFPTGTGLSSSASGFAALTLAGASAAGLRLSEKKLSILARLGSGSACRSIPDGFVEWIEGESSETSYAKALFAPNYWDIADVVAIVSKEKKDVSSSVGQTFSNTSPFFSTRQKNIKNKISLCKKYIEEKGFKNFGELIESESMELHAIYLTSNPSLVYLTPETLFVIREIKKWREKGLPVYFTLNTGQDVHLICEKKNAEKVASLISGLNVVKETIINYPTQGAHLITKDLF